MGRFARLGRLAADVEGLVACVRSADVLRGCMCAVMRKDPRRGCGTCTTRTQLQCESPSICFGVMH
jgi:hypothetical protein